MKDPGQHDSTGAQLDEAELHRLLDEGARLTPLKPRSKVALLEGWPTRELSGEELLEYFSNGHAYNVGQVLGFNGMADVDQDCAEAWVLGPLLLPETLRRHGRPGAANSHYWYQADPLPEYVKITDPDLSGSESCIIEVRAKGHQTMIPPSIHPRGEKLQWEGRDKPASVAGADLVSAARLIGGLVVVSRCWPSTGSRHDASRALAGVLVRKLNDVARAAGVLRAVARLGGDEEWRDRGKDAETTFRRLQAGQPIEGLPTLLDTLRASPDRRRRIGELLAGPHGGRLDTRKPLRRAKLVPLADVQPEEVVYVLEPYLARGMVNLIEGDPGVNKTTFVQAVAALVSLGLHPAGRPEKVILLHGEDSPSHVIRPRLEGMEANLHNIMLLTGLLTDAGGEEPFTLDKEGLEELERAIREYRPALVVVDPIVHYLPGKVDMFRPNDVRAAMAPVKALAERYDCAIVGVRHLNKQSGASAAYRGQGSMDFYALARSVLLVGKHPHNPDVRVVVHQKCNYGPQGPSQAFSFVNGVFGWLGESSLTAADILDGSTGLTSEQEQVLNLYDEEVEGHLQKGEPLTAALLAERLQITQEAARKRLERMTKSQLLMRVAPGSYVPLSHCHSDPPDECQSQKWRDTPPVTSGHVATDCDTAPVTPFLAPVGCSEPSVTRDRVSQDQDARDLAEYDLRVAAGEL